MLSFTAHPSAPAAGDPYRGAQHTLAVRVSGVLTVVLALTGLLIAAFHPPTAQVGSSGWYLLAFLCAGALATGLSQATLRRRPSWTALRVSSFGGVAQVALVAWLAGGHGPYLQLLILPVLGSAISQSPARTAPLTTAAVAAAFTPALYAGVDALAIGVEFGLLAVMAAVLSLVMDSTREHRAQLVDAGYEAQAQARQDPVTGLLNRRGFDEQLAHSIVQAAAEKRPLSLVLCDVDAFKEINDVFGHAAGDDCLRAIARALRGALRAPDTAFRWAGDEFAVLLFNTARPQAAQAAARLREAVSQNCRLPDGAPITIGCGVAEMREAMSPDELLAQADHELLRAKAPRGSVVRQLRALA